MRTLDYSTLRTRLHWFAWPTLLSAALLGHFLVSAYYWLSWFVGVLRNPHMRGEFLPSLPPSVPAFLLVAASAVVLAQALRGRPVSRRGVLVVLVASATWFGLDVRAERYQIAVNFASTDYWDGGGFQHVYFTWWWYNDLWFK